LFSYLSDFSDIIRFLYCVAYVLLEFEVLVRTNNLSGDESDMAATTLTNAELINRRSGRDRRGRAWFSLRLLLGAGNRGSVRRLDDRGRIFFVDWYSPRLFVGLLAGLFLSVADAFLTLLLLDRGAYEVNPIMAFVLGVSPVAFVASKYVLTCVAALIVLMLRDVVVVRGRKFPAHVLLYFFVGVFALVVAWEIYLFSNVV
jgi:Domain of unknown function (DUF5658)